MGKRDHKTKDEPHGIRLPGSLLDELKTHQDGDDDSRYSLRSGFNKKRKQTVSRKDERKQQRESKKQRKVQNHQRKDTPSKLNASNGSHSNGKSSTKARGSGKVNPNKSQSQSEISSDDSENFEIEEEEFKGFNDSGDESKEEYGDSDDYDDFDDEDDFNDDVSDDVLEEEEDDNQPQSAADTMKALMALKAKKKQNNVKTTPSVEETMALLKAKKAGNSLSTSEETLKAVKPKKETKSDNSSTKSKKSSTNSKRVLTPDELSSIKRDEDDIKYYAKKLGLKNGKISDLKGEDDGLGGLLEGLDFLDNYGGDASDSHYSEDEFGEEEDIQVSDDGENYDEEGDTADKGVTDHEVIDNPFSSDDEINSSDFDSDLDGELEGEDGEDEGDVIRPAPKENPYVAPVATKYIPPALRQRLQNTDSEQLAKIKRSIKGPLNKLSEANIMTIVNDINAVYMDNPRQLTTESLTSVVLDSIIQQSVLLDTFVLLHAAFIAAIYRLQGVEVGAYFIQTLVEKYEEYHKNSNTKEASNLISLLTACYSFQVISSKLLYNLIRSLIGEITEQNTELLLRIVKNAGQQMRADDPNSLKEIILNLQETTQGKTLNARTRFLVESISNLKNNKNKLDNEIFSQLVTRMRKVLGSINNNKFHEPLQVSLDDIHSVKSKGKWWLVGSAWKGNGSVKDQEDDVVVNKEELNDILDSAEPNWMELAKAQRMNTDIRRAIFISIMSSNDYIEAFTKLDKLRLRKSQEREIPKILLHCVSIEKVYNPYYGLLANKLCSSHGLRKTFQFSFWDFIKEVEGDEDSDDEDYFKNLKKDMTGENDDFQLQRVINLGKFYGSLIAEGSLPLHSLKTVNFLTLNSDTSLFVEVLIISFFDNIGKKSEVATFGNGLKKAKAQDLKFQDTLLVEKLAKSQQQKPLLRGLRYFLQEKVRDSDIIQGRKQRKRVEWATDLTCDIVDEFLKSEGI